MAHVSIKTKVASIKFTPEQYGEIEKRAEGCGVRVSTWMRSILLQVANQKPRKGHLRIREPDGATT